MSETNAPRSTTGSCPECRAGKHRNCGGDMWDFERDELVTCGCHAGGHGEREVGK